MKVGDIVNNREILSFVEGYNRHKKVNVKCLICGECYSIFVQSFKNNKCLCTNKLNIIGKKFKSNCGVDFLVECEIEPRNKKRMYSIIFDEINGVKYKNKADSNSIFSGRVRNKYAPTLYGVGYLGEYDRKDYRMEYDIWRNMICRCYGNYYSRRHYKGTTVDERWHSFTNFVKDMPNIDGYDFNKIKNKELHLDKDLKSTSKIYSLSNCTFLSQIENNRLIFKNKKDNLIKGDKV